VAKANQQLIRHNIILGVDDRGKLSCQKTHLCFIYFDTSDCVKKLQSLIEAEENTNQTERNPEEQRRHDEFHSRMDIDDSDIVVTGANTTRISRKQVIPSKNASCMQRMPSLFSIAFENTSSYLNTVKAY